MFASINFSLFSILVSFLIIIIPFILSDDFNDKLSRINDMSEEELKEFYAHLPNLSSINLPDNHLPYYFTNFEKVGQVCYDVADCPYKDSVYKKKCWGYEYDCKHPEKFSTPHCPGDHKGWVQTKEDQIKTFYTQADFGFIKQQLKEMMVLCEPMFADDSSLECSEHLRFCRGRNIMVNFSSLASRDEPLRYKMDVLKEGDIGNILYMHEVFTNLANPSLL